MKPIWYDTLGVPPSSPELDYLVVYLIVMALAIIVTIVLWVHWPELKGWWRERRQSV